MSSLTFDRFLTNARKWVPFLPPKPISPLGAAEQHAPLLTRLPPEVRWLIWDLYFGGYAVHCYMEHNRLRAKECLAWDEASRAPHHDPCGRKPVRCHYVPLLMTCREIYFECIDTLYRRTSFDFSHGVRSITLIPKRLPAHHAALISKVHLSWELYHPVWFVSKKPHKNTILWMEIWETLAAMEGLEWLRFEVRIAMPHEAPLYTQEESTLWDCIRKVTRPSHFELILPFPAAEWTREETLPCTVIRRVEEPPRRPVA